jgi:hypothetical protein
MGLREFKSTPLEALRGNHDALVSTRGLYLLMKDLNVLSFDRPLVTLALAEDEEIEPTDTEPHRRIDDVGAIRRFNGLLMFDRPVLYTRLNLAKQPNEAAFELSRRDVEGRKRRGLAHG